MRKAWLLALLLAGMTPAAAADEHEDAPGPDLVPVAFHPFPDSSDILGFPAAPSKERDHYSQQYATYDLERDGFDFPHAVIDGAIPVEGIPDPSDPLAATKAAYSNAIEQRLQEDPPVVLRTESRLSDELTARVRIEPRTALSGEDLHVRIVLVEDHVFFAPPAALSNGITNHRFTARAIHSEPLDLSTGEARVVAATFALDDEWDPAQFHVAAWIQQGTGRGNRFDPLEVVQASLHAVGGPPTRQEGKAVLLEMYTATWCDTCLYGDLAFEQLADEHGAGRPAPEASSTRYLLAPQRLAWMVPVAGVLAAAVALPRMEEP